MAGEQTRVWRRYGIGAVTAGLLLGAAPAGAVEPETVRVSESTAGAQADAKSTRPAISADGRFLAFGSGASTLVEGDTNGLFDIFVRDLQTGVVERVSVGPQGRQADRASFSPSLSADGRFVAYSSYATNLVDGDRNGQSDVFVHDRDTGTTVRATVSSTGAETDKYSSQASLSADGRYVAYSSHATTLVPNDRNSQPDTFVHDTLTGTTVRVSVSSAGREGRGDSHSPWISADGRVVTFYSLAPNLVDGDTNGVSDVFVHDLGTATTRRVSVSSTGAQSAGPSFGPTLSGDGKLVAFSSKGRLATTDSRTNDDIYLHDRTTGTTTQVSRSAAGGATNGRSLMPAFSADGRYLAYSSTASNLVAGDTNGVMDVFRLDRTTGTLLRSSVGPAGVQANGPSAAVLDAGNATVSTTGAVGFYSDASNLVPRDTNRTSDIFVR